MVAKPNPLYERQAESKRTTINGVPTHLLHGKLPPAIDCPYCGYPCFELDDPDVTVARQGADDERGGRFVGRMELQMDCIFPAEVFPAKASLTAPACGHPYHLAPHTNCRPGRLSSAFPVGLIVRPPA